jgi:hypothetical protein
MAKSKELCRIEINAIRTATELGHPTDKVRCFNRERCSMNPDTCVVAKQEGRMFYVKQNVKSLTIPNGAERFYKRLAKTVAIREIQVEG